MPSVDTFGLILVVVGIAVIVTTLVLAATRGAKREEQNRIRSGGAIIIGPVPVVFGTDVKSLKAVLTLAIALTALAIILTIILTHMA